MSGLGHIAGEEIETALGIVHGCCPYEAQILEDYIITVTKELLALALVSTEVDAIAAEAEKQEQG